MKSFGACVLGLMTFLLGLLMIIPASLVLWLVLFLVNCLLWVFNKGLGWFAEMSEGDFKVNVPGYFELEVSKEWRLKG